MNLETDARQEAEQRYLIRLPYNREFEILAREQEAFIAGAVWRIARGDTTNHENRSE